MTDPTLTGNKVKFVLQCQHSSAHFDGTFASDSFKAVMVSTTDTGQKVTVNMTGRRIGDCATARPRRCGGERAPAARPRYFSMVYTRSAPRAWPTSVLTVQ